MSAGIPGTGLFCVRQEMMGQFDCGDLKVAEKSFSASVLLLGRYLSILNFGFIYIAKPESMGRIVSRFGE